MDRDALETQRILRVYKRLVLLGRAHLPLAAGRSLVGPDCAYHLYFRAAAPARGARRLTRARRGRRRSGVARGRPPRGVPAGRK
jgi:hypothetical protein